MLVPRPTGRGALLVLVLGLLQAPARGSSLKKARESHKASVLNGGQLRTLSRLTDVAHMEEVLDNICIPRIVGSEGHEDVKNYIVKSLKDLNWNIEIDKFDDETPVGKQTFENIIAKWNPNADRFLTLACHYDSKFIEKIDFVGATDSAVPCMQLINLAKVMNDHLKKIKNNNINLMLLFLDGEEAFVRWNSQDSIYGARNLVRKWDANKYTYDGELISDLDKIDLFVLLDLIGTPKPNFYIYFNETSKWSHLMARIEKVLSEMDELKNYRVESPLDRYFINYHFPAGIEDDHIPFLKKNVPILHLIPSPFPAVWHQSADNRNIVDMTTVENLNKIFRVFVAAYLNIEVKSTRNLINKFGKMVDDSNWFSI